MNHRSRSLLMVAGEASGDLHASKVVARLLQLAPDIHIYGIGGDRMRAAGMDLEHHSSDFAVVGLVEVLRHVPRFRSAMTGLLDTVSELHTRAAVLVDYPGFNLVLAGKLKRRGVKVLYYISPQVWAWGERRVTKIADRTDEVAVILPFECGFYRERGVQVDFVGHPLMDEPEISAARRPKLRPPERPLIGLLPGSRRSEIARNLPPMLGAVRILRAELAEVDFELGLAEGLTQGDLDVGGDPVSLGIGVSTPGGTHALMERATVLMVSSGTATLESACFGTPMVVVYRMSPLSYLAGRAVVRIPHIGLVNVVAGEQVVPELVQRDLTPERLAEAVLCYLRDPGLYEATSRRLLQVKDLLGEPGTSDRVARKTLAMLEGA